MIGSTVSPIAISAVVTSEWGMLVSFQRLE